MTRDVTKLRGELDAACRQLAGVLDTGARDPTWAESQAVENAAIALGRYLNKTESNLGKAP